jgi:hypothetical protein
VSAERPKWPHLENLDRVLKDDPDFFDPNETRRTGIYRQWTISEKLHGFNARFGVDADGVAWAGGRNEVAVEGDPSSWEGSKLQGFVGFAAERVAYLAPGMTVFGEWAGKGVQKGINYGDKNFYAFGLMVDGQLTNWNRLEKLCAGLNINLVPLLYIGWEAPQPVALQNIWRQQKSRIAEEEWEGVVVSAHPPKVDRFGHITIVKVKSPKFEERAHARTERPAAPDLSNARAFAADYVTDMRMEHVLAQVAEELRMSVSVGLLREEDTDPLDPKNTGRVLKAMFEDVMREGRDDFAKLSEEDQKLVRKAVPPLAKESLTRLRDSATLSRANNDMANEGEA